MAQYIDKSALVAEIERIKKEECPADTYEGRCKMLWFEQFSSFLDTLEVKEVDLEKEVEDWVKTGPHTSYPWCTIPDAIRITAEYFFELGLKAQKGE